jgi:hypothetical protein
MVDAEDMCHDQDIMHTIGIYYQVSTYTIYTNEADGSPLKFHVFNTDGAPSYNIMQLLPPCLSHQKCLLLLLFLHVT